MVYKKIYKTMNEYDDIVMYSDGKYLIGLYFWESKNDFRRDLKIIDDDMGIFKDTERWLDEYFNGVIPNYIPKYRIDNLTEFRALVLDEIIKIPYGKTVTYNDIAKVIARKKGIKKMSAQAVGGAVGWNPIGLIIPCHRVVGTDGKLVGYGGGIKNKKALLEYEKIFDKK